MKEMGMTDSQFKAFIRLVLSDLEEAVTEEDLEKKEEKLKKTMNILQSSLED